MGCRSDYMETVSKSYVPISADDKVFLEELYRLLQVTQSLVGLICHSVSYDVAGQIIGHNSVRMRSLLESLTKLCCGLITNIPSDFKVNLPYSVAEWSAKHMEADLSRAREEIKAAQAKIAAAELVLHRYGVKE